MAMSRILDRLAVPLAVFLLGVAGCGGASTVFQGKAVISVAGTPAAPEVITNARQGAKPPPPPPAQTPRVDLRDNKIVIAEKVQFEVAKATIKEVSHGLLDEVADLIKKNPQVKKIGIEGHASAEGGTTLNLPLSDQRANAVLAYLVSKGVSRAILSARGFGDTKPLADNSTDEGREKNRRVEFNVLEQEVTPRKVEVEPKADTEKVGDEKMQKVK